MSAEAFVVALVALAIGGAVGYLFGRKSSPNAELTEELDATKEQLQSYQQAVTEHFAETAQRVNKLSRQYQDVHDYLASSAMRLANPEFKSNFLAAPVSEVPKERELDEDEPETPELAKEEATQ